MKKLIKKPIILAFLIIIGLIFLNSQGLLEKPKGIFFKVTAPFQKLTYQIGLKFSNSIDLLKKIKQLNQENIRYRDENQKLKGALIELKEAAQENEFLRQQLNLEESKEIQLILANVIGQDPVNSGEYLLLDKGKKDGLEEGAAVIMAGNLLVGRISEVSVSLAKVLLITHPNSRINALIQESRVKGIVRGESGLNLTMDWIASKEKIEPEQVIITSGLANLFPEGLLIGQIREVIPSQPQVFQRAVVKPAVDFEKLEKVFVIKR